MIPEIGLFALIVSLVFALLLTTIPTLGLYLKRDAWCQAAHTYATGVFVFILLAYAALSVSFLLDDFSVVYVLSNSSAALPWFYKLCAVWGGHEGSMLLWVTMLSAWMYAVSFGSRQLDEAIRTRALVILGLLCAGFILFLLTTSNPFTRQFSLLFPQGRDLNPLLQDPGFLFHPPMLYMGYVGFAVAFSLAIAALWLGNVKHAVWTRWAAPWTLAAWCCLTAGITLGSWWAYRELGWGGWWFWDPVENASFMPWLVGTALFHSLLLNERQQRFQSWSILLAIIAFSLSLVGTFLVRSGVLTSVHAFAVDPARGLFILGFLAFVIGASLTLFACRAPQFQSKYPLSLVSREGFLLLNNLFLMVAMLTILMGTVYPLIIDGLGLGKLSVGAPYFNTVFVPIMLPFIALMSIGVHAHWQRDSFQRLTVTLGWGLLLSIALPILVLWWQKHTFNLSVTLGLMLSTWLIVSTLLRMYQHMRIRKGRVSGLILAMAISHIGVAVTAIGIAVSTGYGVQRDLVLASGEGATLSSYSITMLDEQPIKGPNYAGVRVGFSLKYEVNQHRDVSSNKGMKSTTIYPEKRIYDVGNVPMTESAIEVSFLHDIYVALGEKLSNGAWSVRLYYKPLVRWIWAGGFLIFLGGALALMGRLKTVWARLLGHPSSSVVT